MVLRAGATAAPAMTVSRDRDKIVRVRFFRLFSLINHIKSLSFLYYAIKNQNRPHICKRRYAPFSSIKEKA